MTIKDFLRAWMRQCALAVTVFTALLCVAERLAPGSVLSYMNLYAWIIASLLLTIVSPSVPRRRGFWRILGLIPVAAPLVAFLALVTSEIGRWGIILTFAAATTAVAILFTFAYPAEEIAASPYDPT